MKHYPDGWPTDEEVIKYADRFISDSDLVYQEEWKKCFTWLHVKMNCEGPLFKLLGYRGTRIIKNGKFFSVDELYENDFVI